MQAKGVLGTTVGIKEQSRVALGSGILAGLLTLAIVAGALLAAQNRPQNTAASPTITTATDQVGFDSLDAGVCFDYGSTGYELVDCAEEHDSEVTGSVPLSAPSDSDAFPGSDSLSDMLGGQCLTLTENYIGGSIYETSLVDRVILPDEATWESGSRNAVCLASSYTSSALDKPLEGNLTAFSRGIDTIVGRLVLGDCFIPQGTTSAYELNSNSEVVLVNCEEGFNGMLFGRAQLDFEAQIRYPGNKELAALASTQCGTLFEDFFKVPAKGFNYRFWRPSEASWKLGDRTLLCSLLDDDVVEGGFTPSDYVSFFNLPTASCFNLGPEEDAKRDTLQIDDQVLESPCDVAHIGQKIGSGELDAGPTAEAPADNGIEEKAGLACQGLFVDFMGILPADSEFGSFQFWFPLRGSWEEGDRRYACAILDGEIRTETLEQSKR